jgi:hypothetical protein
MKIWEPRSVRAVQLVTGLISLLTMLVSFNAEAVPAFARQTGQNCLACHAGGQFPS